MDRIRGWIDGRKNGAAADEGVEAGTWPLNVGLYHTSRVSIQGINLGGR